MAPFSLKIWEDGFEFISDSVLEASLQAEDARNMLEYILDDMMTDLYQLFESQGRRGGGSWAALNEGYLFEKIDQGYDERILYREHFLVRAATVRDADYQEIEVDESSIYLTVLLDYAAYHQTGARGLPQRKWMEFTDRDRNRWAAYIAAGIVAPIKTRRYSTYSPAQRPL